MYTAPIEEGTILQEEEEEEGYRRNLFQLSATLIDY